jgi:hypothetical protein
MDFEVIGPIRDRRTIAVGSRIRKLPQLTQKYGRGRWRKVAGTAWIRLADGSRRLAELHWYEAVGMGRREIKISGYLPIP